MGILYVPDKPKIPADHRCSLPNLYHHESNEYKIVGTIYQCDICEAYYCMRIHYGMWEWKDIPKFYAQWKLKKIQKKQKKNVIHSASTETDT